MQLILLKKIPYGRTKDRANPCLVLKELQGTCSTKHAVLKLIAEEQAYDHVRLYLCLFKMNSLNKPKLTGILNEYSISFIPEAHFILKVGDEFLDVTNINSSYASLKKDVIRLLEIQTEQIGDFKIKYHQNYLKKWLFEHNFKYSFLEFWNIREQCIKVLSD